MAAAFGPHPREQRHPQQGQIANDIENLVTHEFISVAQAGFIEHAVPRQNYSVVERASANQICAAQSLDFFDKSEGARRGNVACERSVVQSYRAMLHTDKWVGKIDRAIDFVNIRGLDGNAAITR